MSVRVLKVRMFLWAHKTSQSHMCSLRLSQKTVDALKCDLKIQSVNSQSFCAVEKDHQALSQQKKEALLLSHLSFLKVSCMDHHRSWWPVFLNPPADYITPSTGCQAHHNFLLLLELWPCGSCQWQKMEIPIVLSLEDGAGWVCHLMLEKTSG